MSGLRLLIIVLCFASSVAMAADEKEWFLTNSVAERGPAMAGLCSGTFNLVIKGPQEQDDCDGFFDVLFYADLKTRKVYWSKSAARNVDAPDYKRAVVAVLRGQLQSGGIQTLNDMRAFYLGEQHGGVKEIDESETAATKAKGAIQMNQVAHPSQTEKARPKLEGVTPKKVYVEPNADALIEFKTAYAEKRVREYRFACPQPGKSASFIEALRRGVLEGSSMGGGVRKLYAIVDSRGDEVRVYHQVKGTDGYTGPSHVVMTIDKWGELKLQGISKEALMIQCY